MGRYGPDRLGMDFHDSFRRHYRRAYLFFVPNGRIELIEIFPVG